MGVMQCGTFSRSIGCLWKNRAVCPPASGESLHTRTSPCCGHTLRHHPLQHPVRPTCFAHLPCLLPQQRYALETHGLFFRFLFFLGSGTNEWAALRTTKSHLRYFDFCGNVLDDWGKTGGQQGDPHEKIAFCLSIHHLWGRTLAKLYQDACSVAYARWLHQGKALRCARGALGHQARSPGRRWPGPQ